MLQHYYETVRHRTSASLLSTSACQGLVFSLNIRCLLLTFLRRACIKFMPLLHRAPNRQLYRFLLLLSQELIYFLVLMQLVNFANDASSTVHFRSSPWHIPCQPYGGFQLSLTTNVFPREQHKVVCNQCLYIECGRPTTISSEVTD